MVPRDPPAQVQRTKDKGLGQGRGGGRRGVARILDWGPRFPRSREAFLRNIT